jgi:hypothetical protein
LGGWTGIAPNSIFCEAVGRTRPRKIQTDANLVFIGWK